MVRRISIRLLVLLLVTVLLAAPVSAGAGERLAVERQVYEYLTGELKLSVAAACGVLANIEHESSFQPTIYGDEGTSFGLCQWHNERFSALRGYCGALGLDFRTVEGQLAYLKYELGTHYTNLLLVLQSIDNTPEGAYRAAYLWCVQFEKPSNTLVKAAARGELARGKYWARYNSSASGILLPQESEPEPDPLLTPGPFPQGPVTIPTAPQEQSGSVPAPDPGFPDATPPLENPPVQETAAGIRWEYPALALIAAAIVAAVIFPGKKKRGKVYSRGQSVIE